MGSPVTPKIQHNLKSTKLPSRKMAEAQPIDSVESQLAVNPSNALAYDRAGSGGRRDSYINENDQYQDGSVKSILRAK